MNTTITSISNIPINLLETSNTTENPNTRSLWNIIWSCLATIFLCTWVAIHPNSAAENETDGTVIVRRIGLMIAMFLVPEMVVCWALRQWILATYYGRKYRDYASGVKWKKVHGFFLIMGGFSYHKNDGTIERLTASKLEELYNQRFLEWPTVTAKQIRDRSKADVLSKSIVLLQTGWFCLQLAVRLADGLVVTELEVTTFAFGILNLIVYILWWDKPFDVRTHVVVRGQKEPEKQYKAIPIEPPTVASSTEPSNSGESTLDSAEKTQLDQGTFTFLVNDLKERLSKFGKRLSKKCKRAFMVVTPCLPHSDPESQKTPKVHRKTNWHRYIKKKATWMWTLLCEQFRGDIFSLLFLYPALLYGLFVAPFLVFYVEHGVSTTSSNKDPYHPSVDPAAKTRHPWSRFLFDDRTQIAVISAVGIIFGGVHLMAWPFLFHTDIEKWLWRSSSLALIGPPILMQVHFVLMSRFKKPRFLPMWTEWVFIALWVLILLLATAAYMAARAVLFVLPLMALRHAPKGAFVDIDWTSHFPHI